MNITKYIPVPHRQWRSLYWLRKFDMINEELNVVCFNVWQYIISKNDTDVESRQLVMNRLIQSTLDEYQYILNEQPPRWFLNELASEIDKLDKLSQL